MEKQEVVSLAAGEQATIVCDGAIGLALRLGTIEMDGALMAPEVHYQIRTNVHRRVTLYSLNGGAFFVGSNSPFTVHKTGATLPSLLPVAKAAASKDVSRVLVVGEARSGKSVAAKLIMNALLRAHAGNADCRHVFVEGDYSHGSVCCSGVIAAAECRPPALHIESPFLETVPLSFFVGHVNPASDPGKDLITLAQCVESAEWLLRRGEHRTRHLVVDTASSPEGTDFKWYTRQLLDLVRPTHVVALGHADTFGWLAGEVNQFRQDNDKVELFVLPPTVPEALRVSTFDAKSGETSIAEYFCGQPSTRLTCAAVVAPASAVTFVRVTRSPEDALIAVPVDTSSLEAGTVVAVSHAQTLEEIPFANIAGLMVIKDVCIAENEVAFYAPEPDMIPRAFLIVGSELQCRPHLLAPFAI